MELEDLEDGVREPSVQIASKPEVDPKDGLDSLPCHASSSSVDINDDDTHETAENEEDEKALQVRAQEKTPPLILTTENQLEYGTTFRIETFEMDRCTTAVVDVDSRFVHSSSPKPADCYIWQPMKPGYAVRVESPGLQAMVIGRTRAESDTAGSGQAESGIRQAIPVMPRVVSVVCFLLNVIVPGLGTLSAGLSVLCCSRPRFVNLKRSSVLCLNAWVALLQLVTTILLLFGWIWSIVWGVNFISVSNKYRRNKVTHGDVATRTGRLSAPSDRRSTETVVARLGVPDVSSNRRGETLSSAVGDPPIIVLHDAPVLVLQQSRSRLSESSHWDRRIARASTQLQQATGPSRPGDRRRQDRVQLLQQGDNNYPEMLLSPGTLETIVIHNGAYFIQGTRPPQPRTQSPPSAACGPDKGARLQRTHTSHR